MRVTSIQTIFLTLAANLVIAGCTANGLIPGKLPPVISCPADATIECGGALDPDAIGWASTSDYFHTAPVLAFSDVGSGSCPATINRTWSATDSCGNTASCVQVLTVSDQTSPILTCPGTVELSCNAGFNPEVADAALTGVATAVDNCDPAPLVTFASTLVSDTPCARTYERTWTAADACGNTAICVQVITVSDLTSPVLTCPPNFQLACSGLPSDPHWDDPAVTGVATAVDNCDPAPQVTFTWTYQGHNPCFRTIRRTWKATDVCGNSTTCIQYISIYFQEIP